jgi:hypothetical protein
MKIPNAQVSNTTGDDKYYCSRLTKKINTGISGIPFANLTKIFDLK